MRALLLLCCCSLPAAAADVGGWMEQRKAAQSDLLIDDCAQLPALAARTPREAPNAAHLYYATGVCYLESDKLGRDPVAAAGWLARAARLGHADARRLLNRLPP